MTLTARAAAHVRAVGRATTGGVARALGVDRHAADRALVGALRAGRVRVVRAGRHTMWTPASERIPPSMLAAAGERGTLDGADDVDRAWARAAGLVDDAGRLTPLGRWYVEG